MNFSQELTQLTTLLKLEHDQFYDELPACEEVEEARQQVEREIREICLHMQLRMVS